MSAVEIDLSEIRDFFDRVERAAKGDFRKDLELFLEGIGLEFLRIVQDEIVRRDVLDSRLLLNSFEKGADGNVWTIEEDGLVLEVGTNVEYASFVNDGHWTNSKGVAQRWVPGYWQGDRFIYDPSADTGMLLKQHWVEGKHYWDSALRILDQLLPGYLDRKLQDWIDNYFGG